MNENQHDKAVAELKRLIEGCRTLQLATRGTAAPDASYAPFLYEDGVFYIFTSELAEHTRNMISNPVLGVMLIADESASRNLFARSRLSLQCRAEKVVDNEAEKILERFRERQGETVQLLKSLPDFHLFRLNPLVGRLIIGFGKAYDLMIPELSLKPVRED